jgi:uncharacterized protein
MNFFDLNVKTITVLLGDECNFNCKYCVQKESRKKLPSKINPEIYNFIKKVSYSQKEPLLISFYGGEPLLYFDKIEEIVSKTRNMNVRYSVTTNGSLLDIDKIRFFNEHKFVTCISWDGNTTINNRNKDLFSDDSFKKLVFKLSRLDISVVLSAKNYPLQLCEDCQTLMNLYTKNNTNNKRFNVYFNEILGVKSMNQSYLNFDYERLSNEIQIILNEIGKYTINKEEKSIDFDTKYAVKEMLIDYYLRQINQYKFLNEYSKVFAPCADGIQILSIDLDGNMYDCQNARNIIGNIKNLDLELYLASYFKYDNTKYVYNNLCKNCEVRKVCYTRCKIISLEQRLNYYCKFKKAIGKPILKYLKML